MTATTQGLLVFALLGLIFGSLASALSYRLPRGLPVAADRSRCPACGTVLQVRDLVPLFSWLAARGRCRHCDATVSWRYPLIEAVTAGLFVAARIRCAADPLAAAVLALTAFVVIVIVVADLEMRIIPDAMTAMLGVLALAARWVHHGSWFDGFAGAAVGYTVAWGVRAGFHTLRRRDGLGFGDVKFIGAAGLYVGLGALGPYMALSGAFGVVLGIIWRLTGRGRVFPFGPALCLALLAGLFGPWEILGQAPLGSR